MIKDTKNYLCWILGVYLAVFIGLGIWSISSRDNALNRLKTNERTIVELKDSIDHILEFTPDNVMIYLKFYEIKYPDTVFKQILLETGRFQSNIFKENNNLFGMKHPKQRITTSLMDSLGYAKYKSYLESIKDYKYYQDKYWGTTNFKGSYYEFLNSSGYSQDSNYIKKIKKLNIK